MERPGNGASFRPKEAQPGPSDEGMVTTMMKLREQLYKLLAKMYNKCSDSLRGLQRHPVGVLERQGEGPVGPGRVLECEGEDPTRSAGVLEREGASQVNPGREPCCAADGVPDPSIAPDGAERVDMVAPPLESDVTGGNHAPIGARIPKSTVEEPLRKGPASLAGKKTARVVVFTARNADTSQPAVRGNGPGQERNWRQRLPH